MRYVALLRGINVGGKNKVEMARLTETFERVGATGVRTYIASGNVIFDDKRAAQQLAGVIEDAIEEEFGLRLKVLLCDEATFREIAAATPEIWVNDKTMRTDVMFLWEDVDSPETVERLPAKDGIDEVRYVPGAILWRVDFEDLTRSGKARLVGTKLYKSMTVRNINTVRKLVELMEEGR